MRKVWFSLSTLTLACILVTGCNRESNKGGPGADKGKPAPNPSPPADAKDHFTVKVPAGNTNVTQGEQKEITVTVDRDGKFDQEVMLKLEAPAGLKVDPATVTVPKGKSEARVTVHANPDAKVGTTNIKVTGTGGGGPAATVEMGIEVKQKS